MGGGGKVRIQHHCVAFSPAGNVINLEFGTPTPNVSLKKRLRLTYEETAEHRSWNPHSIPGHHAEQPRGGQEKKNVFDKHDLEKDEQKADGGQRRNFSGFLTHEIN